LQSYQGGCGGLCESLLEPAECATALARGTAIGYSDLGHESTALNDDLKNVQLYSKMIRMVFERWEAEEESISTRASKSRL
jgi:hypothetical protein